MCDGTATEGTSREMTLELLKKTMSDIESLASLADYKDALKKGLITFNLQKGICYARKEYRWDLGEKE